MSTLGDITGDVLAKIPSGRRKYISADAARSAIINAAQKILADLAATQAEVDALAGAGTVISTISGGGVNLQGDSGLTKAQAASVTFPAIADGGPSHLYCTGYATAFDTPRRILYKRQSTNPAATVPFPASGFFQSADGDYWVIKPQHGEFWVEEFGAQGRSATDTTDQWQAFEDCKYAILMQGDPLAIGSGLGGMTMRIGRGGFYFTKSHSIEGCPYNVKGSGMHNGGTTIRTPPNVDAFQIQYNFGGQGQTFGHEGAPLNSFPRALNSLCYVPGGTHVYKSTNTGSANMSSPPTGTGTGITSGSATFDYVRERTWSETRGFGADYSTVSDLVVWSKWTGPTDSVGYDEDQTQIDGAYHSGILMRARATIEDVAAVSYPGFGIACCADGDPEVRSSGNVNGWVVRRVRLAFNGHAGIRNGLSDSNAGSGYDIDCASNLRGGVEDFCFLGNRWFNIQDDRSGAAGGKWKGGVIHNGYAWLARAPEVGADAADYSHEPGTDEFSWIRRDGHGEKTATTDYPNWNSADVYAPCGGYISNNTNAENQVVGLYIEGGGYPPQPGVHDVIWGGALGNGLELTRGGQMYSRSKWQNQIAMQHDFSFDGPSGDKRTMEAYLGGKARNGGKPSEVPDSMAWGYRDWEGNLVKAKLVGMTSGRDYAALNMVIQDESSPNFIMGWTGNTSTVTFGRSSPQRGLAFFPKIAIGNGSNDLTNPSYTTFSTTTGHLGTGTSAAGSERNGEVIFYVNTAATSTDPTGWIVRGGFFVPF